MLWHAYDGESPNIRWLSPMLSELRVVFGSRGGKLGGSIRNFSQLWNFSQSEKKQDSREHRPLQEDSLCPSYAQCKLQGHSIALTHNTKQKKFLSSVNKNVYTWSTLLSLSGNQFRNDRETASSRELRFAIAYQSEALCPTSAEACCGGAKHGSIFRSSLLEG